MTSALPVAALAFCLTASSGCGKLVVRAKPLPERASEVPTETTADTSEPRRESPSESTPTPSAVGENDRRPPPPLDRRTSPENRSVTLEWTAPTKRTDGSVLAPLEIAGYHVRVWRRSRQDDRVVEVGQDTKATIPNLKPGRYYFAVSCIDTDGAPSDWSEGVSSTVR